MNQHAAVDAEALERGQANLARMGLADAQPFIYLSASACDPPEPSAQPEPPSETRRKRRSMAQMQTLWQDRVDALSREIVGVDEQIKELVEDQKSRRIEVSIWRKALAETAIE